MRFVEIPGLGAGEMVLVNPEHVGAIIPISPLNRAPGIHPKAGCQVIIAGQALLFPQTAVAFRALLETWLAVSV